MLLLDKLKRRGSREQIARQVRNRSTLAMLATINGTEESMMGMSLNPGHRGQ
jgi:hypothetical protein